VFPQGVDSIIILSHLGGDGLIQGLEQHLDGRGEVYKTDF
jgi:hypothetical protein